MEAERERPDIARFAAPDSSVTILFTDIENSTGINESVGDEKWLSVLQRHDTVIRSEVAAHDGHVLKSRGDGFMIIFRDPFDASRCAIAIERRFADAPVEVLGAPLRIRIGLHRGTAILRGGDVYGKNVNLAARIADSAAGGQIIVSAALAEIVGNKLPLGERREVRFKGLPSPCGVHALDWRGAVPEPSRT